MIVAPSPAVAHRVGSARAHLDDGDDLGVGHQDHSDGDEVLDHQQGDGVGQVGPGVGPVLHADVVKEQGGLGEVEVDGSGEESRREDGEDGHDPDEHDHESNGGKLKCNKVEANLYDFNIYTE